MAIIRELCPDWEIYPSQHQVFDSDLLDLEVQMYEQQTIGWKMCLNTTEFLFHPDVKGYLREFEREHPGTAIGVKGIVMVDDPLLRNTPARPDLPLWCQREYGYFDDDWGMRGPRFLHPFSHGRYWPGRHRTDHPHLLREDIHLLWWALSPYQQVLPRRMQIAERVSQNDRLRGRGLHHLMNREELEAHYQAELQKSDHLIKDPRWEPLHQAWREKTGYPRYLFLPQIEFATYD